MPYTSGGEEGLMQNNRVVLWCFVVGLVAFVASLVVVYLLLTNTAPAGPLSSPEVPTSQLGPLPSPLPRPGGISICVLAAELCPDGPLSLR